MKRLSFYLTLLFSFLVLSSIVFADGGMYRRTFDKDVWIPIIQEEQISVISYDGGKETMIISVKGGLEDGEIAWIFPIPAKPEQTDIDIVEEFPKFSGYEVKSKVGYEIDRAYPLFYISQAYPIVYYLFFAGYGSFGASGSIQKAGAEQDFYVEIHEHIEFGGLTSELVTTKDEIELYGYLQQKNLDLPPESLSIIEEYIGKDYSFVVSWISDGLTYRYETGGDVLGVKTVFPTNNLFYPLKLTSIYGETKIPMTIVVSGHVSPSVFSEIEDYTNVNYYRGERGDYTKININSKSRFFVKDFWISRFTPPDILLADIILISPTVFLVIVFGMVSILSSIISGFIFYRNNFSWKRFASLGLGNFLTIFGFSIATLLTIKSEKKKSGLKLVLLAFAFTIILFVLSIIISNSLLAWISILCFILLIPFTIIVSLVKGDKRLGFIGIFSIMFIIISLILNSLILSAYPYVVRSYGQEGIKNQACAELNPREGCIKEPSSIIVYHDINDDGEIDQSDNWQAFAEMYYGCEDSDCAKRVCGCPGY